MNDNVRMSDDASSTEEISKSELSLATDIMLAMLKSSKAAKMYQANNPLLGRFFQELTEKMSTMLAKYSEYKLEVDRFELSYKGHKVYENTDTNESMAFRMYSDGIRSIIFSKGIEESELRELLEIVNTSISSSIDDDIVTLLWDKGLPHCSYILEDDFQEIDRQIDDQMIGASARGKIPPICLVDPFSFATERQAAPNQLCTLSGEERSSLRTLVEAEEKLRPLDDTARILSVILSGVAEPDLFSSFLEIYLKLTRNLFLSGNGEFALKMFAFLCRRATSKEPYEERRRQILHALGKFWTDESIKGLCKIIDTTDSIPSNEFINLSVMIGQTSPSSLCELLGLAEKMKIRKVLIETTTEIAKEKPQLLLPYLKDSRWYLVRNMVCILTRLKSSALLDQVVMLITHSDQRVRKEVLKYLIAVPEPKAKPYILKFLRDEASAIRILALQMMGRARLQFALKPISAFIDTVEFDEMDISEKKAVYEAIGELGGEKMLPLFKEMLTRRFLFNKAKEKDSVILAVAGLQKIPGKATLQILEEALRSKSNEYSEVINNAIHMANHSKPTAAAQQEES
jgi:hypothetical protein